MRHLLFALLLAACQPSAPDVSDAAARAARVPMPTENAVRTGAQVLADADFGLLAGRRVGLVVNHTARVGGVHLIDRMHASPNVELVALFGPEHGLRGDADAGERIADGRDEQTGLPVYSLYGNTRKPTPAMLAGLDVLVFDIQDIGARFYTFISTMGLAMQAAAEAGVAFVVLDRPNPLGGVRAGGFVLEPAFTSFVGQYPIPVMHGLTVGELARLIEGEALLPGLETLTLEVVPMDGWHRAMLWPSTGLPWLPTSPNIPDFETALLYPGACFFEATAASEGRGTRTPFLVLGAPWGNGAALANALNAKNLPGLYFEAAAFTPQSIEGMSASPKLKDTPVRGIRQVVTDAGAVRPVEAGIHMLHAFYHQAPTAERGTFFNESGLRRLAGTERLYDLLTGGATPEAIIAAWQDEVAAFEDQRRPYLLYE